MKTSFLHILLLLTFVSSAIAAEKLEKAWELTGLSNPESVIYDQANGVLYVSNVNGTPDEKDGNGFISRVSMDGNIMDLQWITGFDAPKGLALLNNHLYVADIDRLVEIDIDKAAISDTWSDANAKFLNDVTATADGRVFVSDMVTNRIHVLENGDFSVWLDDANLESPNGLHAESDQLIVGAWGVMVEGFATDVPGHMKTVSLKDKTVASLGNGTPVGNLDGVEPVGKNFYVTDWMNGRLFRIDRKGNATLLLTLEQGMADHEYIQELSMMLVPMMKNNSLLAYRIK